MSYQFGCIINCKNDPDIKHFVLSLGVDSKNRVMYYIITSRVYKAFPKLCNFFNINCMNSCKKFEIEFKEKDKKINPVSLIDVFFVDKDIHPLLFTENSMIVINGDPYIKDISAFNQLKKQKLIFEADLLSKVEIRRLYTHIKTSDNVISPDIRTEIDKNYAKLTVY